MLTIPENKKLDYSHIPKNPGCYIYRDINNEIIYIGKAKNLVNRIRSYFSSSKNHSIKTKHLVSKIASVDWIIVDNEVEALLLENNLIKKHYPKYNIDLKDNKKFAYLKITDDLFPKILTTRVVGKDGTYFGPYTDGYQRVQLIKTAVSIFKLRVCKVLPKNACLNFHIGICTAPCINNVDEKQYNEQVVKAKEFLKGNMTETIAQLTAEMKKCSDELKFEKALERKRQLEAISNLMDKQRVELVKRYDQDVISMIINNENAIFETFAISKGVLSSKSEYKLQYGEDVFEEFIKRYYSSRNIPQEIIVNKKFYGSDSDKIVLEKYLSKLRNGKVTITHPKKGDKLALVKLAEKNALMNLEENTVLKELQEKLNLPEYPKIIECFDISNLGYEHIVGGMTRFVDGRADKSGYRKFKINTTALKQDDFMAMGEVVLRRYKRLKLEDQKFPDLIIIDGGLGQLNAALSSLKSLGLKIPIISLAKQNEEIFSPSSNDPIQFDNNSKMMILIREIRDSVHSFVLGYNKKRREMKLRDEFKNLKNK